MRDFYQDLIDVAGSGGEACCVIAPGDTRLENDARTTFVTKGQGALDNLTFTYSGASSSFATPIVYVRNQFRTPLPIWDGSADEADTPDADAWSRDDSSGEGMSITALVAPDAAQIAEILSRSSGGGIREYRFRLGGTAKLEYSVVDESANVGGDRVSDAALPLNIRSVVGVTNDGSGGATAMNGVTLYLDGAVLASAATNNASYVAMENLVQTTTLASREGPLGFFSGMMGLVVFTHRQLTLAEHKDMYDIYVAMQKAEAIPLRRRR